MRLPLYFAWLELTHRCNLRCRHCYSSSTNLLPSAPMSTARLNGLLEEIAAAGVTTLQLTGGEPLLHPEVFDLLDRATSLALQIELFTNATLLDERRLDRVAELGIDVATSLYSHDPSTHDSITGVDGSHAATVEAISGLVKRQVEVRVATILMESNADHGPKVALLLENIGVLAPHKTDPIRPSGRGRGSSGPPPSADSCSGLAGSAASLLHAGAGTKATCWCGKIAVTPNGAVIPCIFARTLEVGTVSEESLEKVLASEELASLWSLTTDDVQACDGCDRKATCLDCRALPLSVHGDLYAKSPRCTYVPHAPTPLDESGEAPRPREPLIRRPFGDEFFVMDPELARLHRLNSVARLVIEALDKGESPRTAAEHIAHGFSVPLEIALTDVRDVISEMNREGILEGPAAPIAETKDALGGQLEARRFPTPETLHGSMPRRSLASVWEIEAPRCVTVDCAGALVEIEARTEIADDLASFLSSLVVGVSFGRLADPSPLTRLTILESRPNRRKSSLMHVLVDGVRTNIVRSRDSLFAAVETLLSSIAARGEARPGEGASSLCLHACAVLGPLGAVVLPAEHGAGKSVFAAWASDAGLTYLGDEVAPLVRGETGIRVRGFPKPIKLKEEGFSLVPGSLRDRFMPPRAIGRGCLGWLPVRGERGSQRLSALIRMERRGRSPTLRGLEKGDLVELLLSQCFNIQSLGPSRALEEACALADSIPGYVLDTSDLGGAARAVATLLRADTGSEA